MTDRPSDSEFQVDGASKAGSSDGERGQSTADRVVSSTRRNLLAVGAGALAAVAGCFHGGGDGNADDAVDDSQDEPDSGDDDTGSDNGESDGPEFVLEKVSIDGPVAFEGEITRDDETVIAEGRIDGDNWYMDLESETLEREMYLVEDHLYLIEGERCFEVTGEQPNAARPPGGLEQLGDRSDQQPGRRPDDTATLAGEAVAVYELQNENGAGTLRFFVSIESGRPRRIEGDSAFLEYTWEGVEPIESPEMDCKEV